MLFLVAGIVLGEKKTYLSTVGEGCAGQAGVPLTTHLRPPPCPSLLWALVQTWFAGAWPGTPMPKQGPPLSRWQGSSLQLSSHSQLAFVN